MPRRNGLRAVAIETSSRVGSVALVSDGRIVGEATFAHGLRNAAEMVPRIDSLLQAQGWTPQQLEEIHVSIGPGSFTGLRIGVTFAKTFAWATGARLLAVPSLAVLAENAPASSRHVLIVLDARRGQVFTARFERIGDRWEPREPARLSPLADALARSPRPILLLGEGLSVHRPPDETDILITGEALWIPTARNVARLGSLMAEAGQFTSPQNLLPLYLRQSEAEEKWESRGKP
jgi:tRNA threonylcarbamoyladenosine biosynthesis protein TsaB